MPISLVQAYTLRCTIHAYVCFEIGKYIRLIKVDRDIMVLANPAIANLPNWVIALVAAGGLAAALSTAAGLLLAISSYYRP